METKIISKNNAFAGIRGTTTINHKIRAKLILSCSDYVLLDLIYKTNQKPILPQNFDTFWKHTGMDIELYQMDIERMINKGMVLRDKYDRLLTTDEWNREFNPLFPEEDFTQFWETFKKHGNKIESRKKYMIVRKEVEKDDLHKRAERYIKWVLQNRGSLQYCKAAEVWLHPEKKHWLDVLPGEQLQQEKEIYKMPADGSAKK